MLNVVNFGGGAYVIYAEVTPIGEIQVDPEPYSDTFDRPARLLPIEAKALVAAIDLIGLAQADLRTRARQGRRRARLRPDRGGPAHRLAQGRRRRSCTGSSSRSHEHRLLELEYWTQTQDRYSERRRRALRAASTRVRAGTSRPGTPTAAAAAPLPAGPDQARRRRSTSTSSARKDLDPIADIGGWPRTGRVGGSRFARVKVCAEQARWAREQRTVARRARRTARIVVEITFKGIDFLVREVLKEAGDAVVLEPADAREAVLAAAEGLIARAT